MQVIDLVMYVCTCLFLYVLLLPSASVSLVLLARNQAVRGAQRAQEGRSLLVVVLGHWETGKWADNGRHRAGGSSAPESARTLRMVFFLLTKKIIKAVCLKLWLMDCMDYLFIFK